MSGSDPVEGLEPAEEEPDVPDWDDDYLDQVSDRLLFNYDLERDRPVRGESFAMYGEMQMHHEKHFLHPALSFAHHDSYEHLFVRRRANVTVADLERLVELGHDLADEWIDADEEHYSTDLTFVVVADAIPDDAAAFVTGFQERTLIKYGYHGHYEIHLLVAAPDQERIVSSREAHVEQAFRLWEPIEEDDPGWWELFTRRLQL